MIDSSIFFHSIEKANMLYFTDGSCLIKDALQCIFVECVYVYMLVLGLLKGKCHSVQE